MHMKTRTLILSVLVAALTAPEAGAERLTLAFLPPDLPPSDVCNVDPERFDEDETQVSEPEVPGPQILNDEGRLKFLSRDIRNLRREDPDGAFDFIMALISRRAELDPDYAGFEETFDLIDAYLAALRLDELTQQQLVQSLNARIDEMTWSQTVRLSRLYLNGIGVAQDRDYAMQLVIGQAYLGNSDALSEVLRMQLRGDDVGDWGLSREETARLAFGGLVGRLNRGLCSRAESMAREYIDGDLLTPNPRLAYAWRKFAADMGGAEAGWRVVEHHLSATGVEKNDAVLGHYLRQAVANGFVILPETVDEIVESGARTEAEIRRILDRNHLRVGNARRRSAVPYFALDARMVTASIAEDGEYLQYLREIAELPGVPGRILTELAREVLLRQGRWDGMAEAEPLLREAVRSGDPDAALLLARNLLSQRADPAKMQEAETLLIEAVERHGEPDAMRALDGLYRCQVPDAPRIAEAAFWASAYKAANLEQVTVSPTDLAKFDSRHEPEAIARIQSLALRGHSGSSADWLQFLQSDMTSPDAALRHWADRVSLSDIALERYMVGEFELALTPAERRGAIELFRRVYLDIGASISLELAIALIEDRGRDNVVAGEVVQLLVNSGHRGQGAAIRLLQRLTGRDGDDVYRDFAADIEARGDFLALMFAAPYVDDTTFRRYMERAISLMNCTTKDVTELIEVHAARNLDQESSHWVNVGLALEGGNTLAKLGLSDRQMDDFGRGLSIAEDMLDRPQTSTDAFDNLRQLYLGAADPGAPGFDAETAGASLGDIFGIATRDQYIWAMTQYRKANPDVRIAVDARVNVRAALQDAAQGGDAHAQYELGMLLRTVAQAKEDLEISADWLARSANAGHPEAIVEYAFAIGLGVGRPADPKLALIWLDRGERVNAGRGRELRDMLSAMIAE